MKSLLRHAVFWGLCGALVAGCGGTPDAENAPRIPAARETGPIDDAVYAAIDRHALNAPPEAERSLDRLTAYLTAPARNDAETARALYRWIAGNIAYDVQPKPFSGRINKPGARQTLESRKGLCDGYSSLFDELARRAGLETRRIRGYSKGHSYYPGRRFADVNHEWIAVKIDGDWRLIDPTWGAGLIEEERFVKKFDGIYFLTPPAYFLFDHLPFDPEWQLVRQKMTLDAFETQAYPGRPLLRSFYHLGVPGEALREAMSRKDFTDFPKVHYYKGRVLRVEQAPITGRLEEGNKYTFSMASPEISGATLLNAGQWRDLEKDGADRYHGTIRPVAGVLKLSVQFPEKAMEYWPVLIYSVN